MASNSSDVCLNESMEEVHSFLDMELEALQSIFINELEVQADEASTAVSIDLHPATADKLDEQYVRMTLQLILSEEYPEKVPEIKIRNPRGLSDEKINCIVKDLSSIAESKRGNSMLFEMIDAAKEHLTTGNRPSGECAICLYRFSENDVFTKTECYHYFHSHCLARYSKNFIENSKELEEDAKSKSISNELLCPMCRIPIQFVGSDCEYPSPEESDESSFVLTDEIVELQKKMADLYMKQVEKGGIIDIEAEKNKYLLEISNVPSRTNNDESSALKNVSGDESVSENKEVPSEEVENPSSDGKEPVKERYQRYDNRGKNRKYGRQNEGRGNYRYQRYNRPSYDGSRGSFNRNNKYGKTNQANYQKQDRESDLPADAAKANVTSADATKATVTSADAAKATVTSWDVEEIEDVSNSQDVQDNVSETSDQVSGDLKTKRNSNSPRYNRGFRYGNNYNNHTRNNYGNYSSNYRNRRPEKPNQESHYSQGPQRYSSNYSRPSNNYSKNRFTDRDQYHAERGNFRGRRNFNRDDRNRYRNDGDDRNRYRNDGDDRNRYRNDGDERNRFRNDGDERNRYRNDGDERNRYRNDGDDRNRFRNEGEDRNRFRNDGEDRNKFRNDGEDENKFRNEGEDRNKFRNEGKDRNKFRNDGENRNKFRNEGEDRNRFRNDDRSYHDGYNKQSSRNYSTNRRGKYTDKAYPESSNNEHSELVKSNPDQSDSKTSNVLPVKSEPSIKKNVNSTERENKTSQNKELTHFNTRCSEKPTEAKALPDGIGLSAFPNVSNENSQTRPRSVNPPPGFANPHKKVIYGLQGANPPPGFNKS